MIKRYLHIMFVAVLAVSAAASCQKKWDMIPPPVASGSDDSLESEDFWGLETNDYYVSVYGDGDMDGSSWDNAIDISAFFSLLTDNSDVSTASFYLAQGTYLTGSTAGYGLKIQKNVGTIYGGYSDSSTGTDLTKRDPELYPTTFTGDLNRSGVPDEGDCTLLKLSGGTVSFDGVVFTCGYIDQKYAEADQESTAGLSVCGSQTSVLTLENCKINSCKSSQSTTGYAGGPALTVLNGYAKLRNTKISGCSATSRGGAIRLRGNDGAVLFMDRCTIHSCSLSDVWGTAVQLSQGTVCICNSTLFNNAGGGAQLNGGGPMLVLNSTIVANASDNYGCIRTEASAGNQAFFMNNLLFSLGSGKPSFVKNKANDEIVSKGYNVYQSERDDAGSPMVISTDYMMTGNPGGSFSAAAGVYSWDVKNLPLSRYAKTEMLAACCKEFNPAVHRGIGEEFAAWAGDSFSLDQRGMSRNPEKLQPGAYDQGIDLSNVNE